MYYRQILLVKASWKSEAEDKARYILNSKFEGKEIGIYCIWGTTVLSKEQVKDYKKPKSGVIMEDDTDHLGIFRANLNEARTLIDRYGHDMFDDEGESFFVYLEDDEYDAGSWKLKYIEDNNLRECKGDESYGMANEYIDDKGNRIILPDGPELDSITDRNDPRLTSRDYFVVPFDFHR